MPAAGRVMLRRGLQVIRKNGIRKGRLCTVPLLIDNCHIIVELRISKIKPLSVKSLVTKSIDSNSEKALGSSQLLPDFHSFIQWRVLCR